VNVFASIWWQSQEAYSEAGTIHKAKPSSSFWQTGGGEEEHHPFLISAIDKRGWSTSRAGRFSPVKKLDTHLIGGCVCFQTRSGWFWVREKSLVSAGFRNLDPG
jgi:hypothetical protein